MAYNRKLRGRVHWYLADEDTAVPDMILNGDYSVVAAWTKFGSSFFDNDGVRIMAQPDPRGRRGPE